ncbi:MAG: heavy metal translocating P-type ATPase [Oscillospiraceae bacterium]|nr:heavy metal translocating P-type ATPase [Oscillospiraceae bacterium]
MTRKQKRMLIRILIATVLFVGAFTTEHLLHPSEWILLPIYAVAYLVVGWDILWKAIRNIAHGQIFDENFLMAIASLGAFAMREFDESVAVMLLYQVGELFQSYAVNKSRNAISSLVELRPDLATVERNGELLEVDPDEIAVGEIIVVKTGERIPLDGIITEGNSTLDTAALTGESLPRSVTVGEEALSGCINQSGLLKIRVTKPFSQSTVSKILELVEEASERKSKSEAFITRFAKYYTPFVVIAAVLLSIIPPIVTGNFLNGAVWLKWVSRALTFLVISCPCALVISVPLSFFGGIGGASRNGILIKGSNYLEALAAVDTIAFDKTGTLTQGTFTVAGLYPANGTSEEQLLEWAATAEAFSTHPIANSLRTAYGKSIAKENIQNVQEIAGNGVQATINGQLVMVGKAAMLQKQNITIPENRKEIQGTKVFVAVDNLYRGCILITDPIKPTASKAIQQIKELGIQKTVLLSGDTEQTAKAVADTLHIDEVHAQLLPQDKVQCLEDLLHKQKKGTLLAYVGDGINDAPVLTRADVGIAMGAMGSDAAIEAADIVLMDDNPDKLSTAIRIARKTKYIVRENIVFALGVKAIVLLLGAMGLANMWAAVFADVGVAMIAICNAIRTLRIKK